MKKWLLLILLTGCATPIQRRAVRLPPLPPIHRPPVVMKDFVSPEERKRRHNRYLLRQAYIKKHGTAAPPWNYIAPVVTELPLTELSVDPHVK